MPDLLDQISADLTLPRELLRDALAHASSRYRKIRIPKRSGGVRTLIQPAAELKPILAWLDAKLFCRLRISDIATAFRRGSSIVDNARAHRESVFSVRIDVTNFFPSIRSSDLELAIKLAGSNLPEWAKESETTKFIRQACFDKHDQLPIGYLTSPRIANAVMFDIDTKLVQSITDREIFGTAVLTRYADDFVFSTNKRGSCNKFVEEIARVLNSTSSPKLQINESKTHFMSRDGGSTLITGLRVKENSEIGVHPNYRDHVRLLMKLYAEDRLKDEEVPKLVGHLAFIEHADPGLFTRLSFRYFDEISKIRS